MPVVNLLFSLLVRLFVLAAGLLAAASIAVVLAALLALWLLRTGWALLTGRPVTPFVMRMAPRHAFEEMMRRAPAATGSRTPRSDAAAGPSGRVADVSDVEPK
jgi:branched-subunit amino acid ABC-type transport system permease component